MSTDFGFSDLECKIIRAQYERRMKYREMFLKAKSDPFMHSKEPGWMFDPAVQRFLAMKATQLEHFKFTPNTIAFAIFSLVLPMSLYGYAIWTTRQKWLRDIACGKIKPKDRLFKFK